jgi:tetratricopeptide (TPR) repeat protein
MAGMAGRVGAPAAPRRRGPVLAAVLVGVAAALLAGGGAAAQELLWDVWGTETYRLEAGESMQFRVRYEQIPVRRWRLLVEADQIVCDLHVLRLADGSLIYFEPDESRHDVSIPWGRGEEISVVLSAGRRQGGVYTVRFLGPPRDQAPASYSFAVNRALEAYAAGRRDEAQRHCEQALRDDPDDRVAMVLLAGFLRDDRYYERAAGLVERALAGELPEDMRELASQLRDELARETEAVPAPIREELARVERLLEDGEAQGALALCDRLLGASERPSPPARGWILQYRGRALQGLDRDFEALEALTMALQLTPRREAQAVIYFHLGSLLAEMENVEQARGALDRALTYGLPPGLQIQVQELLRRLGGERP